jgi:hypothetical protein
MRTRIRAASLAALWHFSVSVFVAALAGALVFGVWYPYPYQDLAGGRELFWLVIGVDVLTGPLLTLVIFAPHKPRNELMRDLALVVTIQICALGYGVWSVWQARPLFLVAEIDRFKVIAQPALSKDALSSLNPALVPSFFHGPITVAIRAPVNEQERKKVLFESIAGGHDYGERPEFYLAYEGVNAQKSLMRAKPISTFLEKYPDQSKAMYALVASMKTGQDELMYLPIVARRPWIAILDKKGMVVGYLPGDGF